MAELPKVDEFAFVLIASLILIFMLAFSWMTPPEAPPFIMESSFEMTVSQGDKTTFEFEVAGKKQMRGLNITAAGEIVKWITFNKNNFDILESGTVTATLDIPENVSEGTYNGRVIVTGVGGRDTFSVAVHVIGDDRELDQRLISLGDFTISYAEGTDTVDSKQDVRVFKDLFSSRMLSLSELLSSDRISIVTGGNIRLVIEDTNSLSNLIVELNEEEIYKRKVGIGEVVIPISNDKIEESNIITIKAGSPGAMFWANGFYDIQTAEFNIDYKGAFAKEFDISLSDKEVDNFRRFRLFYRVIDYSTPVPLMMIKLNDQIVYWDKPPLALFNVKIDEDMLGNPLYLNEGINTIKFMFEENAEYTIADATLTVDYYE